MPLIPVLAFAGRNAPYTESYLEDKTGVYDATTNPGGYGGPNYLRNQVVLFLFSSLIETAADLPLVVKSYDAPSVSIFTVLVPRDGVVRHRTKVVVISDELTFPSLEGAIRFFPATGVVAQKAADGSWTPLTLAEVSELKTMGIEASGAEKHELVDARGKIAYHELNEQIMLLQRGNTEDCAAELYQLSCRRNFMDVELVAAKHFFCKAEYNSAQLCLEAVHNQPE